MDLLAFDPSGQNGRLSIPAGAFGANADLDRPARGHDAFDLAVSAVGTVAVLKAGSFTSIKLDRLYLRSGQIGLEVGFTDRQSIRTVESYVALQSSNIESGAIGKRYIAIMQFVGVSICPESVIFGSEVSRSAAELQGQTSLFSHLDVIEGGFLLPCECLEPGQVKVEPMKVCVDAPSGQVANNGVAQLCPVGRFSDLVCILCAAGTYNPRRGQGSNGCLFCPSGKQQPSVGATSAANCTSCSPGSFASVLGTQECTLCPQGSYTSKEAAASCMQCPAGTYGTRAGASLAAQGCAACPGGASTAGPGTASEAGCIAGTAASCGAGQDRSIETGACVPLQCGLPLLITAGGQLCEGCANGTVRAGATCTPCGGQQLCPGGTSHAVVAAAALQASSAEVAQHSQLKAAIVPTPSSSLLAQAALMIVTLAVACMFGLDHKQHEGTSKILKRTPLGSALTLRAWWWLCWH